MANLHFVQMPIGRLPLSLKCLSNGCVAIDLFAHPLVPFKDLLDLYPAGVSADFSPTGFKMYRGEEIEEYSYGEHVAYKQQPLLLKWLQQQEMEMPVFKKEMN